MANTPLTSTIVTRKALQVLHQKLNFVGSINRQYDDSFANSGAKIGDSIKIRLPNEYTVRTGKTLSAQDTAETSVTLQLATQKGVDVNFSSAELTLSIDDFAERILEPAMAVLAASVEADALSMAQEIYQVADNTTHAATMANVLLGRKRLVDALAPPGKWQALLCTQDNIDLVDSLKGLFQDSTAIKEQYREGYMGRTAGFEFSETTLLGQQARSAAASYVCNTSTGITSGSATITVSGGTGTPNTGETFTIAGVNRVHPETKVDTGALQQFVIITGSTTVPTVYPTPVTSGATQNVVINSAGASKTVTFTGTASTNYGQSLVYHPNAFTFATADLVLPKGVDFAAREVYDGISLRTVRAYDINNDAFPCRIDIFYGYKTLRRRLAARLLNN